MPVLGKEVVVSLLICVVCVSCEVTTIAEEISIENVTYTKDGTNLTLFWNGTFVEDTYFLLTIQPGGTKWRENNERNKFFYNHTFANFKYDEPTEVAFTLCKRQYKKPDCNSTISKNPTRKIIPLVHVSKCTTTKEGNSTAIIVIICLFVVLLVTSLAFYFFCRRKKFRRMKKLCNFRQQEEAQVLVIVKSSESLLSLEQFRELLRTSNGLSLEDEFESARKVDVPETCGSLVKGKNRYQDVLPVKATRVVLKTGDNDYINANYIDGYNVKNKYIATQGPLQTTFNDFWRMIIENKTEIVIMLTNLTENGRIKCHKYWEENTTVTFEDISVKHSVTIEFTDYDIREFFVTHNGDTRKVMHYHFKTWRDKSIPLSPLVFAGLLKKIRNETWKNHPIVVHCSAGIGRTGVYILCDYILDMYEVERKMDFASTLGRLRSGRCGMVQSEMQYKFSYCVVDECLKEKITLPVSVQEFKDNFDLIVAEDALSRCLQEVNNELYWRNVLYDKIAHFGWAKNKHKEKFDVEPKSFYPFLSLQIYPSCDRESFYINAQKIPNQSLEATYITTNQPLENTVTDFWRMVDEHDIKTIISMYEPDTNFYPTSTNDLQPTDYLTIKYISTNQNNYTLQLTNSNESESNKDRTIQLLQLNKLHLTNPEAFICSYKEHISLISSHNTTIICCPDGVTATGIFLAFTYLLERVQKDGDVDIFTCISILRLFRDEYMTQVEQLKFVYECLLKFIE